MPSSSRAGRSWSGQRPGADTSAPSARLTPLPYADVTPEIRAWASALLHDKSLLMGGTATKAFDGRTIVARIEWHPPSAQIPHVHRGVSLYRPGDGPPPQSQGEHRPPIDPAAPPGERAAQFALGELRDGVREDPPGSNRGPRIDQNRGSMGSPGDPWCAWGFCYTAKAVLQPGEILPHAYTGSVAEIVRTGHFRTRGDGYRAKIGDGAVWARNGQDPLRGGNGHIGRVIVAPDATARFQTIEANSGDAWAVRTHRVDEEGFLGWVEYPPSDATGHVQLREPFFVARIGQVGLDDYVARVVTAELGGSRRLDALKALAVATRTYVEQALAADPTRGTEANPVPNSQLFQVAASTPTPLAVRAATETHGGVALWRGKLIVGSHVAGAVWAPGAWRGVVSAQYPTEKYITYNEGLVGDAVHASPIASMRGLRNRGCLSQNGADALATRGYRWNGILRFFCGADLEITLAEPANPQGPRASELAHDETSKGSVAPSSAAIGARLPYWMRAR